MWQLIGVKRDKKTGRITKYIVSDGAGRQKTITPVQARRLAEGRNILSVSATEKGIQYNTMPDTVVGVTYTEEQAREKDHRLGYAVLCSGVYLKLRNAQATLTSNGLLELSGAPQFRLSEYEDNPKPQDILIGIPVRLVLPGDKTYIGVINIAYNAEYDSVRACITTAEKKVDDLVVVAKCHSKLPNTIAIEIAAEQACNMLQVMAWRLYKKGTIR